MVRDEAAEQQQHSETNQDKVDDPEAPIRAIVVYPIATTMVFMTRWHLRYVDFEGCRVRFAIDPLQGNLRGNSDVFRLAWGVVTQLVDQNNVSFLFGCSSFAGTQPSAHSGAFRYLCRNNHIAPDSWRPVLRGGYPLVRALENHKEGMVNDLPPLLRAYLGLGGKVSDHAAIDPDLGTTVLFTGVNVAQVPQKRAQRLRAILAAH